jgi:hypothetical protein
MTILRVKTEWEGSHFPTWRCICEDGEIRPNEKTLTRLETIESEMAASMEGAEWREYAFALLAPCGRCFDHSVVGGVVRSEPGHEVYTVNLFSPSPIIVPRRSGMPPKLGRSWRGPRCCRGATSRPQPTRSEAPLSSS